MIRVLRRILVAIGMSLSLATIAIAAGALIHFDRSVPNELKRQVIDDLNFVRAIPAGDQSVLHQKLFRQFSGPNLVRWFTDRVPWIGYDRLSDEGSVAYNIAGRRQMFITKFYVSDKVPQVARLSILFHEARHSEPAHDYWDHATCPTPYLDDRGQEVKSALTGLKLAGFPACDSELLGAYGVGAIFLYNLAVSCETCTEKMKMDAIFYANESRDRMRKTAHRRALTRDYEDLKLKHLSGADGKPKRDQNLSEASHESQKSTAPGSR